MSDSTILFNVRGVSSDDLADLHRGAAQCGVDVSIPETKQFGPSEWHSIMIIVSDAGKVASTAISVGKIAKWLYDWYQSRKTKGPVVRAVLQAKGKNKLALEEALNHDVEAWLRSMTPADADPSSAD